jgi:hypothetical protein
LQTYILTYSRCTNQCACSLRIPCFTSYHCHRKLDSLFHLALSYSFCCRDSKSVAPVTELASLQDPTATIDGDFQHPRIASILGVHKRYRFPLLLCRGFSICPSLLGLSRCVYAIWRSSKGQDSVCLELELWLAAVWVSGFFIVCFSMQRLLLMCCRPSG